MVQTKEIQIETNFGGSVANFESVKKQIAERGRKKRQNDMTQTLTVLPTDNGRKVATMSCLLRKLYILK